MTQNDIDQQNTNLQADVISAAAEIAQDEGRTKLANLIVSLNRHIQTLAIAQEEGRTSLTDFITSVNRRIEARETAQEEERTSLVNLMTSVNQHIEALGGRVAKLEEKGTSPTTGPSIPDNQIEEDLGLFQKLQLAAKKTASI